MFLLPLMSTDRARHWPWLTLLLIGLITVVHLQVLKSQTVAETRVARVCASWPGQKLSDTLTGLHLDWSSLRDESNQEAEDDASLCEMWTSMLVGNASPEHALHLILNELTDQDVSFDEELLRDRSLAVAKLVPPPLAARMMQPAQSWNPVRWLSSSFVHGDWSHLVSNMLFFFAFSAAFEALVGSRKLLMLIIESSLLIGLGDAIFTTLNDELGSSLGFSGVVMAVMGAMLYLVPHAEFRSVLVIGQFPITLPFRVSMLSLALLYIAPEIFQVLTDPTPNTGINVLAHANGAVIGFLLATLQLQKLRPALMASLDVEYLQSARHLMDR